MNALLREASDEAPIALSESSALGRLNEADAALTRLYGSGYLERRVGGTEWRFRWSSRAGDRLHGVELLLRVGGVRVVVGLCDLSPFGSAADVARPELPGGLRAPYLNSLGMSVWQELETLLRRTVEVVEVRLDAILERDAVCLGFDLVRGARGPVIQGWLRFIDPGVGHDEALQRILLESSARELTRLPTAQAIPLSWAAVVGCTSLSAAEVWDLEALDIVLVDEVRPAADALHCALAVGPERRRAGQLALRNGVLQMVQFNINGGPGMSTNLETPPRETGLDEIPITLRFELAQWTASLAEVGRLAPGAVVDLGQKLEDHTVSLWIEQRCIGKGQLVIIGERLGVRMLEVPTQ